MTSEQAPSFTLGPLDEHGMTLFAQLVAVVVGRGDVIALEGDLGAGKTTFARSFVRAIVDDQAEEIPSPTYTLVQTYEGSRLNIAHFDLYRITDPAEFDELGVDHALGDGVAVIEWPTRVGDRLPKNRLELRLRDPHDDLMANEKLHADDGRRDVRVVELIGHGEWSTRVGRLFAAYELIGKSGFLDGLDKISYLAGDASARRYARLVRTDGSRALLMDWPQYADTNIPQGRRSYNQIAHIAENVTAFVGVANAVRDHGLSAPKVFGFDIENGLVVLQDFGDRAFFDEVHKGTSMPQLWRAATDTLVAMRTMPVVDSIAVSRSAAHVLPRFDHGAMWAEVELLADWYWPSVHGEPMPDKARQGFAALWDDVIERLLIEPPVWLMRDFHSPNLVWLPDLSGAQNVGIIDFQDAVAGPAAYDLVSLLQDARVSVPATLELELLEHYCARAAQSDTKFDKDRFLLTYAALGAQRNTKILGIFARLAKRDGKPHYLAHIPRIWDYLARDLRHPGLRDLAAWYDEAFDATTRCADEKT